MQPAGGGEVAQALLLAAAALYFTAYLALCRLRVQKAWRKKGRRRASRRRGPGGHT